MLKRLSEFLGIYRKHVFLCVIFNMLSVVCELLMPLLMAKIVDVGIKNSDIGYIRNMGILMVSLALFGILFGCLNAKYSSTASAGFSANIRKIMFEKVSTFSFSNIDKFSTASLTTRLTNDINTLQMTMMMGLRILIRAPMMLVCALFVAISINAQLAVVMLVAIPLLGFAIYLILRGVQQLFSVVQQKLDRLNLTVQENITAMRVVKSFVRGNYEREKFKTANDDLSHVAIAAAGRAILTMPAMMIIMNLAITAIIWFGGRMVYGGTLLSGELLSFISYITQIMFSLMIVSSFFIMSSRAEASGVRILEVLDEVPDIGETPASGGTSPIVRRGSVEFKNVSFKYNLTGTGLDVLKNISFRAEPGEVIAIIGGTGTGKSSLVNLIPRFYDVTDGTVLVDGRDVRDYGTHELRERIGMVLQTNTLFSGTVRENLRWGNPDATDDELVAACASAQAHEFITSLPGGYDAILSQGGTNLSGGQKQRLCIARAMLKKPLILILDDSTSAVDSATESKIRESFAAAFEGTTVFLISQRISSVREADHILVLDNGELAGYGKHDELMAGNEVYREIYYSQQQGEGGVA